MKVASPQCRRTIGRIGLLALCVLIAGTLTWKPIYRKLIIPYGNPAWGKAFYLFHAYGIMNDQFEFIVDEYGHIGAWFGPENPKHLSTRFLRTFHAEDHYANPYEMDGITIGETGGPHPRDHLVYGAIIFINPEKDFSGTWHVWSERGVLVSEEEYACGLRHGVSRFYDHETGELRREFHYRNGVRHGSFRIHFRQDTVSLTGNHTSGKPDGEWIWSEGDGSVLARGVYQNGTAVRGTFLMYHSSRYFIKEIQNGKVAIHAATEFPGQSPPK